MITFRDGLVVGDREVSGSDAESLEPVGHADPA
jgi:hypothetical protein